MLDAAYIASLNCLRLMNDTTAGTLPYFAKYRINMLFWFHFTVLVRYVELTVLDLE